MQLLTESGIGGLSWPLYQWLSKLPKDANLEPSTSLYKVAFELYEEHHPNSINKTVWEKLRGGYCIAYSKFEEEFKRITESLIADKENRISYIRGRVDDLYMGQMKYDSLMKWGNYVTSDSFKELKSKIDIDLWDEMDLSGAAAHQAATYGIAISNMMERALQIDGKLSENGRLSDSSTKQSSNQEKNRIAIYLRWKKRGAYD